MHPLYNNKSFLLSLFFIVLLVFLNVPYSALAQEIFQEIGWNLNVDPYANWTDAGGMVDVNNDGWIDLFPGWFMVLNNSVENDIYIWQQQYTHMTLLILLGMKILIFGIYVKRY